MSATGHNQIRSFVERIERLEEEKAETQSAISEVYAEAKDTGLDVKALRAVIRLRKQDRDERDAHLATVERYMHALGMLADTPLGRAAVDREFADTKVTITAGGQSVETTAGTIQKLADDLSIPDELRRT